MKTLEQIFDIEAGIKRIVPGLIIKDINVAKEVAHALLDGGLDVATVRIVDRISFDVIRYLAEEVPELTIGAGFVFDSAAFMSASLAGAKYISSPGATPELFTAARTRFNRAHFLPGAITPSEVLDAYTRGFDVVNFYPAEYFDGYNLLQLYARSFSKVAFSVHGGTSLSHDEIDKYLALPNVLSVGISSFETSDMIANNDFAGLRKFAEQMVVLAKKANELYK